MSQALARHRCFHHAAREAVARCPECERFYCRECVTEHDDRVICSDCLARLTQAARPLRERLFWPVRAGQLMLGVFLIWMTFHLLGESLSRIPDSFHGAEPDVEVTR